eukprot:scaffold2304_cov30-Tisochrysis_lutea.AAC.1
MGPEGNEEGGMLAAGAAEGTTSEVLSPSAEAEEGGQAGLGLNTTGRRIRRVSNTLHIVVDKGSTRHRLHPSLWQR